MIDFRYHLISIVAVLLALSIGIVMGTGVFGGPLLEDLKDRVEEVRAQNGELRAEIDTLQGRVSDQQRFAEGVEPFLVPGRLEDTDVVVIEFEGIGGGLVDEVRDELEMAGARVASTLSLSKKFALEDQTDIDQLALTLRSSSADPEELRREAASAIGSRAASAAAPGDVSPSVVARLEALLEELDGAGFLSVGRDDGDETVPSGASFVVLGGADDLPGYEPKDFAVTLSTALARGSAGVVTAERTGSKWDLIRAILDDSEARDSVATVGGADGADGRIAVILGLEEAIAGSPGHYGSGDGADSPLPEPAQAP